MGIQAPFACAAGTFRVLLLHRLFPASCLPPSIEGTPGSLAPSTVTASNALRTDWLFSYRPTPGTVLLFGYGGSMDEPDPRAFRDLARVADSFFMKVSYVFR